MTPPRHVDHDLEERDVLGGRLHAVGTVVDESRSFCDSDGERTIDSTTNAGVFPNATTTTTTFEDVDRHSLQSPSQRQSRRRRRFESRTDDHVEELESTAAALSPSGVPCMSDGISIEDETRLKELFSKLDRNDDGQICIEDLAKAFRELRLMGSAEVFMSRADDDGDNLLNFHEFANYMLEHEHNLKLVFKTIDVDKDGAITLYEIQESLKRNGIHISESESEILLKRLDRNNSCSITWEEWRDSLLWQPHADFHDILHYWRHATFLDIGEDSLVPDDFTEKELQTGMWWRHLVAGGLAGAVSRTCTAPLDRLKVMLQVYGSVHGDKMTIVSVIRHMLGEGGVRSMWRGNGINVVKIAPESAIKFMAYDKFKRMIKGDREAELQPYERMIAGSSAGALAQTCIYPMELIKTRLAIGKSGQYKGILDCAKKCVKNEGLRAFYKGYLPNILGIIPYAGIDLTVYELLKKEYTRRHVDNADPNIFVLLACGTISSTCGQLASYPLALIRTKMQAAGTTTAINTNPSMMELFKGVIKNEGFRGLYRGIAPNFLKVAPAVSISYVVYESVRTKLGVEMKG